MKKILLWGLLCICSVSLAQTSKKFYKSPYDNRTNGSFNQSSTILSVGYGFQNDPIIGYGYGAKIYNTVKSTSGPLYAKLEHGFLRDDFGIGVQVGYANTSLSYSNLNTNFTDHVNALTIGVLGYYHFSKVIPIPNLDVYAGLGLSTKTVRFRYDESQGDTPKSHSETSVYIVGKVGARYYVTKHFGLFIEGGFDHMSDINVGLSFKAGR